MLLLLNIALAALPSDAAAQETTYTNGLTFSYNDEHTVTVSGYEGTATEIIIPDKVSLNGIEYAVTAINRECFSGCYMAKSIVSVDIPASVKTIGYGAFYKCSALASVTLHDSLETIETYAFYSCNLASITIPKTVTSIGESAFRKNANLTKVVFADGCKVTSFGNYIFTECPIASLSIPGSFETVPGNLFSQNSSLKTITLGEGITSIGEEAFYGCSSLKSVTLPNSLETIGNNAFQNTGLTSVDIPSTVTTIGVRAFSQCQSLSSVTLHDGLQNIGLLAFYQDSLNSITIPATVKSIGNMAFAENTSLTDVVFAEGCNVTSFGELIFNASPVASLSIPGSFGTIPASFLTQKSSLLSLTLGEGITKIGKDAFSQTGLQQVNIPASVGSIEPNAFERCSSLTSVTFASQSTLTQLGSYAFYNTGITDIALPASLGTVGSYAFGGCESLKTVTFPEDSKLDTLAYDAFNDSRAITTVSLPGSLKTVPKNLFHYHSNLASVTLGEGIEEIGANAFNNCGLTGIVLPSSLKTVGSKAFHSCKFTELTIPASVTSIGEGAFLLIENLSVTCLGSTPATAGTDIFYSPYLKNIRVPEDAVAAYKEADEWSTYKSKIQAIPPTSFTDAAGCTYALAMSADGNSLTATLTSCSNKQIENLRIPNVLYKDGSPYTWNDNNIQVTSIADSALADCDNLTLVLALSSNVTTMGTGVFGSSLKAFVVNVMDEDKLNELKAADGWKEIADKLTPRLYVAEDNDKYYSIFSIDSPSAATFVNIVFKNESEDGEELEYTVPDHTTLVEGITLTTTDIASDAFSGRSSITKLTIPSTVQTIGIYAFSDMYNLKELHLPDNLKYIGMSCFSNCYNLTVYYNGDPAQIVNRLGRPTDNESLSNSSSFPVLIVSADKKAAFKNYNDSGSPWGNLQYIFGVDELKQLCLTDETDITTAVTKDDFYKAGDLSYKRTFNTPGQYATVCLPFAINPADYADQLDIYRLTKFLGSDYDEAGFALRMDGTKIILSLEKVDCNDNTIMYSGDGDTPMIYPLEPLFVKAKEGVSEVTFKSVSSYMGEDIFSICEEQYSILLDVYDWDGKSGIMSKANDLMLAAAGTVSKMGADSEILSDLDVYTFNADGSFGYDDEVPAFRMFIMTPKQSAQAAPLNISIGIDGETTGIDGITDTLPSEATACRTAPVYSLDGKMVSADGSTDGLKKGIYIKNKKKFVVK